MGENDFQSPLVPFKMLWKPEFHSISIILATMVEDQLDNSIMKYECIS